MSAASPIERAICADRDLSDQKSGIAASLDALHPLVPSHVEQVEAEQRRWAASLAEACAAADPIEPCLKPRLAARASAVYRKLDRARAFGVGHPLRLGSATVEVEADGMATGVLKSDGKAIASPFYGQTQIVRRFERPGLEAALILEGESGSARCGNYAVISFQPATGVRHTLLTSDFPCADDKARFELTGETPDGLYVSQEAAPFEPRVKIVWTAPATVATVSLAYHPTPGTRLRDAQPNAEPLQSADLFAAIERETGPDVGSFQRALWHLNTYGGPDDRPPPPDEHARSRLGLYGISRTNGLLVLRGCGWDADHTGLWCDDLDAIAVEDAAGRFFFAIRSAKKGSAPPRSYPSLDAWPKAARSAFETWLASPI